VHESVHKLDLKLDPLATERGRGGQSRNLGERPRELFCRFD
jgi:hypothetical protein